MMRRTRLSSLSQVPACLLALLAVPSTQRDISKHHKELSAQMRGSASSFSSHLTTTRNPHPRAPVSRPAAFPPAALPLPRPGPGARDLRYVLRIPPTWARIGRPRQVRSFFTGESCVQGPLPESTSLMQNLWTC